MPDGRTCSPRWRASGARSPELKGSDTVAGDYFGLSVAISGTTAVVGAAHRGGRAYVFTETAGVWKQVAELKGGLASAGGFGLSVAISGTTAIVGDPYDANSYGRAYVFTETAGVWKRVAALKASFTLNDDFFGGSVAISGTTAIVGAYGASDAGRAYVFTEAAGVWSQVAELKGSDIVAYDHFGGSVSISGTSAVVGAPGAFSQNTPGRAYMFTETAGVWTQVAELKGSDTASDYFGGSVAIAGTSAVVGAEDDAGSAGRAYVFTETAGVWSQVADLKGSDTIAGDFFGLSVAISGTTAVVGAPGHGRAYVFGPPGSILYPGTGLSPGAYLQSVGGQFHLVMQRLDGNLVLYTSSNRALWETRTYPNPGASVVMQRDGNLVVYSASGRPLWDTHTSGNLGSSAVLQRDGNFVIYSASGKALWSSGT
jgi:hypothetical protein